MALNAPRRAAVAVSLGMVLATVGSLIGIGPLGAASADGGRGLVLGHFEGEEQVEQRLVESSDCRGYRSSAPPSPGGRASETRAVVSTGEAVEFKRTRLGMIDGLQVMVPSSAIVRVDHRGRPLAVMTNTGCAPRPSDQIWLVLPEGTFVPTVGAFAATVTWVGDFRTPGVYVRQPGGESDPRSSADPPDQCQARCDQRTDGHRHQSATS
jgi:hypothetical protein